MKKNYEKLKDYAHNTIHCKVGDVFKNIADQYNSKYTDNNLDKILEKIIFACRKSCLIGDYQTRFYLAGKDIKLIRKIEKELRKENIYILSVEKWRHFRTDMRTIYFSLNEKTKKKFRAS